MLLLRRHALFGGATGSGKSGGLNVLMGNLTACADVVIWAIDLKRGMELGPWASCIARLATTPAEARDPARRRGGRPGGPRRVARRAGQRVWEPSPDLPALVIIVDEYAELADAAPEATGDADSIARRGRAVAVTLIAATQRPTQKAMGQGALRSQMDVRICFRVRERKDVDLDPRPGHARRGLARPHAQRARQVPHLRTRARHAPPRPRATCSPTRPWPTPQPGTRTCGPRWTPYPGAPSPNAPRSRPDASAQPTSAGHASDSRARPRRRPGRPEASCGPRCAWLRRGRDSCPS